MKVKVDIFRIAEKLPEQDEYVMVKRYCDNHWMPRIYNKQYNYWDTEDGDDYDYDCDVDENDIWMRLPQHIDIEFANIIK